VALSHASSQTPPATPVETFVARGLDRALFQKLAEGGFIDAHENLILCGPTGVGKARISARS
jgi:DNA replication protein DnaC